MLFEKEFEFIGKHAIYCRMLRDDIRLFPTYREVYLYSTLIGFLHGKRAERDINNKEQKASILPSELAKQKAKLKTLYKFIMLLHDEPNFTIEDYKVRTFKYESEEDSEKLKETMEIFNSYARGGVELLYEKFTGCDSKKATVKRLHEILEEFIEDNGLE